MDAPPDPSHRDDLRSLRHDIRGRMNALILCATALDGSMPREEALEFLTHIEQTADKLIALVDRLEAMP
jgi:nitrogen-specific signal transduction histidine kinase